MIIIDDFISDRAILDEIEMSVEFQTPRTWGWWDGWWKTPAGCNRERVVQYIWGEQCPFPAAAGFPNLVAGFEYWSLAHEADPGHSSSTTEGMSEASPTSKGRDRLQALRDRDEWHFPRTGETKHPRVGAVSYPLDHRIKGGYLKIFTHDTEDGPFELIEPRFNRLIIFDSSVLHEVTPVTVGRRYSLAINVWDYRIQDSELKQYKQRAS